MTSIKRKISLLVFQNGKEIFSSGELRVDFTVNKSIGDAVNTSKIDIYNLAPATALLFTTKGVATLSKMSSKDVLAQQLYVRLSVSHFGLDTEVLLFEGYVQNSHTSSMFEDKITTLWCWQKGGNIFQTAPEIPETYTQMPLKDLITAVVKGSGGGDIPIDFSGATPSKLEAVVNYYVRNTPVNRGFAKYLAAYQLQFFFDGNTFVVFDKLRNDGRDLINTPKNVTRININLLKKPVVFDLASAVVTYNLSPEIVPANFLQVADDIKLQSQLGGVEDSLNLVASKDTLLPKGFYQIMSVAHSGSCYTDLWQSEITGVIRTGSQ